MDKTVPFTLKQAKIWRERFGTPFYVYDADSIRKTVSDVRKAFWPRRDAVLTVHRIPSSCSAPPAV